MNVELKIYGLKPDSTELQITGEGRPAVHPALQRQHQGIIQQIVILLRTYGVEHVVLDIVQGAGPIAVGNISMGLLAMDTPAVLAGVRPKMIRDVIRPLMEIYGINSIKITLSEQETAELKKYWEYLNSGDQRLIDEMRVKDIPLRYEVDPTAGTVGPTTQANLGELKFETVTPEDKHDEKDKP